MVTVVPSSFVRILTGEMERGQELAAFPVSDEEESVNTAVLGDGDVIEVVQGCFLEEADTQPREVDQGGVERSAQGAPARNERRLSSSRFNHDEYALFWQGAHRQLANLANEIVNDHLDRNLIGNREASRLAVSRYHKKKEDKGKGWDQWDLNKKYMKNRLLADRITQLMTQKGSGEDELGRALEMGDICFPWRQELALMTPNDLINLAKEEAQQQKNFSLAIGILEHVQTNSLNPHLRREVENLLFETGIFYVESLPLSQNGNKIQLLKDIFSFLSPINEAEWAEEEMGNLLLRLLKVSWKVDPKMIPEWLLFGVLEMSITSGNFYGRHRRLLSEVLNEVVTRPIDPSQQKFYEVMGMHAFADGNYSLALGFLKKAKSSGPVDYAIAAALAYSSEKIHPVTAEVLENYKFAHQRSGTYHNTAWARHGMGIFFHRQALVSLDRASFERNQSKALTCYHQALRLSRGRQRTIYKENLNRCKEMNCANGHSRFVPLLVYGTQPREFPPPYFAVNVDESNHRLTTADAALYE